MPYYNDVPYYYGGTYANHSSLMTGTGRPFNPLTRFSPHLSTISESPLNHLHRFSPATARHARRVIDTADIDVSSPRILSHDGNRPRNRLRRDRPTIKIRSQALKDNPALRQHNERHEKSVGELLMEKFFIKDKKSDGEGQQVRLYHQVSLERDEEENEEEEEEEREAMQKRITRRFTRRRSSADLQLDPEQMQREAAYAQVQAQVLDSLVAEEQAQIENEARCGTLIRKGTLRGQTTAHPYYNADSDVMTREEEEAAALRMRKAMKKTKKKKKQTDKPSPPDKLACVLDNRRSSTSSEMSTDSRVEEDEEETMENGPRPQMYKIEACNSAGDFSTIWVNASENEKKSKPGGEQYRESVRVPIPRKPDVGSDNALRKSTDEAETRFVLPVRRPYTKDPSRNSVYLTVKKPVEKLDERLDETNARDDDGDQRRGLVNGFIDAKDKILADDSLKKSTSEESPKLNGEVRASDNIKDVAKEMKRERKIESFGKKDPSKSSLDNDVRGKRDAALSKVKDDGVREGGTKDASSPVKDAAAVLNSIGSNTSAFIATNAQTKQTELLKDAPADADVKKNKDRENDVVALDAAEKWPQVAPITKTPKAHVKDSVISLIDKHAGKEEEGAVDAPRIPMMPRENVTTRRSVVSIDAGDTSENSASSVMLTPAGANCLPKPSKINADRNNAVEAAELSLREAAYLADSSPSESERAEDVVAAPLPGKKTDKAPNLAKNAASCYDATRKANGVDAAESILEDDATKLGTGGTTLRKGASNQVRSNEREIAKITTDVKSIKDTDTAKTSEINAEENAACELSLEVKDLPFVPSKINEEANVTGTPIDVAVAPKATNLAKPLRIEKISAIDVKKDPSRDSGLSSPKSKVPKFNAVESKFPFKPKIQLSKTAINETSGKDSNTSKVTKNDDGKTIPIVAKKDVSAPRFLKKSVSVDSSKPPSNDNSSRLVTGNANIPKVLRQCVSVDEKVADKSMPVKKTSKVVKSTSKETEKKLVTENASSETSQEESVQLSKSASNESIDFWSEIKAPDSPEATTSRLQRNDISREATVIPKNEDKTGSANPKWIPGDPPSGKSSTVKELEGDKKNETDVKISVAPSSSAVGSGDVTEEKTPREKVVPESPKAKAEEAAKTTKTEIEKSAQTVQKAPRKKKNLSLTIGIKDPNATVKKAPLKREDSATPVQSDTPKTPDTAIPIAELPTPVLRVTVPVINIVEAPPVPTDTETQRADEECEDPSTPTNELPDLSLTKITKWSNRNDLTNADDAATPVASEEASLAASPTVSPQSSKTKRVIKKKKPSSKKAASLQKNERETKESDNDSMVGQQKTTLKPTVDKQHLTKTSPKTSPRSTPKNSPSQRPLDLIRMFYTTPSALLTATPRDLSKVRRAKIKRRKHHSRTPSVSSDSTGSTTSTATTESSGSTCTELDDDPEQKRMNSTRSNDSGFDGSPRISNCDMACHKKCEKLTGNLCGLNQKLVAEALQALKRAPSQSSDNQRNSDSSDHFSSGRITPPATNLPRFKKYLVTDFNFLKVLGKGSFGKVLLAELRGTECVYAVKCLKKDVVLEDDDVECTLIERKVLTLATRHPYLCHLFCTFQTDSHLFFVMEYLNGGDLMFHIQKSGRFPEARARFYAAEIWSGLNFLHKKGIVYRDLKLDNVLLDFEGHIRIADFGMCKLQIFLDRTADTFCGTPDYMAPEIVKGLKYNQAVDWWSYGVLLYEMLTGQSPFSGCDEDELFWSICNERPFIPRYLSQEATDMLVCLLEKDSGKRPPGHEIAMHAFFQHLPWDRLERRQLEPPFRPALDHTLDTRYFDTAFTTERPRLTPVPEQILTSMDQDVFRGFSYTNPNATD